MRLLLPAVLAVALSGCDCVFEWEIEGVVQNQDGQRIAGVAVTSCSSGERCKSAASDTMCQSVTADRFGAFSLSVQECVPKALACELRPIVLRKEGCVTTSVSPSRENGLQTFSMFCR